MKIVESEKYLGDFISSTGSNSDTIRNRVSIGNGVIAKIRSILENMSLGKHYFKIAFLLRESLFLNGILYSSEAWYGLTKSEIADLEKVDMICYEIFSKFHSQPQLSVSILSQDV